MIMVCIYHIASEKQPFNPTDYAELMDLHFNQHKVTLDDANVFAYLEVQGYNTATLDKYNTN